MIMMIKVYSQPLCINALCHSFIRTHPTLKTLELLPIPLVLCSSLEKITLSQKALSLLTSLQCPLCQKCLTGDRFITMSALINPHFTGSRVAKRKGTFLLVSQTSSSSPPALTGDLPIYRSVPDPSVFHSNVSAPETESSVHYP